MSVARLGTCSCLITAVLSSRRLWSPFPSVVFALVVAVITIGLWRALCVDASGVHLLSRQAPPEQLASSVPPEMSWSTLVLLLLCALLAVRNTLRVMDPGDHVHQAPRETQIGMIAVLKLRSASYRPVATLNPRSVTPISVQREAVPAPALGHNGGQRRHRRQRQQAFGDDNGDVHLADSGDFVPVGAASSTARPPPADPPTPPGSTGGATLLRPAAFPSSRRSARRPRKTQLERKERLTAVISATLRQSTGVRTRAEPLAKGELSAQLVGSQDSSVRVLFCVVGPSAVDLATLWFSPGGSILCSCWEHKENVALLSLANEASSCWHAECFSDALRPLGHHRALLQSSMQVHEKLQPHAILVDMGSSTAGVAFDGDIFSPVVASRRRDIKCISTGCRSLQRRCHHTTLVRGLEHFASARGVEDGDAGSGDDSDEHDGTRGRGVVNYGDAGGADDADLDDEELVAAARGRQKRNLLACLSEDQQCDKWRRTADFASLPQVAAGTLGPATVAVGSDEAERGRPLAPVQQLTKWGLAFDPSDVLHEACCTSCGVKKPLDTALSEPVPARLICDGPGSQPVQVCSGFFANRLTWVSCCCGERSLSAGGQFCAGGSQRRWQWESTVIARCLPTFIPSFLVLTTFHIVLLARCTCSILSYHSYCWHHGPAQRATGLSLTAGIMVCFPCRRRTIRGGCLSSRVPFATRWSPSCTTRGPPMRRQRLSYRRLAATLASRASPLWTSGGYSRLA